MKRFNEFTKLNETEMGFSDIDFDKIQPYGEETDLEYLSLKEIGKGGKLAEYIDKGGKVKFGMMKALYHDAVEYKKKREYEKGVAKFFARVIPMALAPIFFPVWLIAQILGGTRA
jgi:hypothetical protein